MKLRSLVSTAASVVVVMLAGCGDSTLSIVGPVLSIGEIESLAIDQFYTAVGLEDEYAETGEFAVYLRDAVTGSDLACAGQNEGMDRLGNIDTYYAGLNIRLRAVEGIRPNSSARFQLVFVEKDGPDCPAPIAAGDDIIGISPVFSAEDIVDTRLWASNGMAAALMRIAGHTSADPAAMAPSMQNALIIDHIGFSNGDDGNKPHRYYLFAERVEGSEVTTFCQIDDADFGNIRFGNMTYAGLNLSIPCANAKASDFFTMRLRLSLWIQKNSGPSLVGRTDAIAVADMIGERIDFTNGKGFIRLRGTAIEPFSSRAVRLEEVGSLKLTSLAIDTAPLATETLEVHFRSPRGYSLACIGEHQGLVGMGAPAAAYTGPALSFAPIEGLRELFGWEELDLVVIGRSDGDSCPAPITESFSILVQTTGLGPADIKAGNVAFGEGEYASWQYVAVE